MQRILSSSLRLLSDTTLALGGVCILAMMLHINADVLSRAAFGFALPGTLEIASTWYMVGFAFLPIANIQFWRAHLFIELFTRGLGGRTLVLLDLFAYLLTAVFFGTIAWAAGESALRYTAVREAADATFFEVPTWPTRWFVVAGFGGAALVAAVQAADEVRRFLTGKRTRDVLQDVDPQDPHL